MEWPTYLTSVVSAIVVAFLGPRFQHLVWSKQKLREQRISVAERFAAMNSNFLLTINLVPQVGVNHLQNASLFLEQDALLLLIQVLFEREDTLASGNELKKRPTDAPARLSKEELYDLMDCASIF